MENNKVASKSYLLLNRIAFILVILVNTLANILPLGGRDTGQISDSVPIMITPAGITFSIWSVIYALLFLLFFFGLGKSIKKEEKSNNADKCLGIWFLINAAANILWIFAWHTLDTVFSIIPMIGVFASLLVIILRMEKTDVSELFKAAFSIYFGWITIAFIVNISITLYLFGITSLPPSTIFWSSFIIIVATGLALLALFLKNNIYYSLTIAWAILGIGYKQYMLLDNKNAPLGMLAYILVGIIIALTIVKVAKTKKG